MARVYISIGSNLNQEFNVLSCLEALRAEYGTLTVSTIYRNKPVGFEGNDFLNLVAGFDTPATVYQVAAGLRAIEHAHGRRRDKRPGSAHTLDLDLLLYDDLVLDDPRARVPRDEITRFAFVLCPLAEIAGQVRHPCQSLTIAELWAQFANTREQLHPVCLNASRLKPQSLG